MIHRSLLLASVAMLALGASPVLANCADEIAALSAQSGSTVASGTTAGGAVSKDGSQAPLEQVEPAAGAGTAAAGSEGTTAGETSGPAARAAGVATDDGAGGGKVAKDGGEMPLSTDGATPSADQAMSQQDAGTQQAGGTTAAGQAATSGGQASMSGDAMVALNRARAAERAGDEAGCMQAIEEVKSLQGG